MASGLSHFGLDEKKKCKKKKGHYRENNGILTIYYMHLFYFQHTKKRVHERGILDHAGMMTSFCFFNSHWLG